MSLVPTPEVDSLLATLLEQFGKKSAAKKAAPSKKLPRNAEKLPQHTAFNQSKTGYRVWKALARIVEIQSQHCLCCGSITQAVAGEKFLLENGVAHATWMRSEGYGIEQQEQLPIEYLDLPERHVTACAACRLDQFDAAILASVVAHQQLSFPF